MLKFRRATHFRHYAHLTKLIVERERIGKSAYVSHANNFRHMNKEVDHVSVR
jgi:hypothetical protein